MFGGGTRKGPSREQSVDTTNVLFIVAGAFVGLDQIIQERKRSKGNSSIGFTSTSILSPPRPQPSAALPSPAVTANEARSFEDVPQHGSSKVEATTRKEDLSHLLDQVEPRDLVSFGLIPE